MGTLLLVSWGAWQCRQGNRHPAEQGQEPAWAALPAPCSWGMQ